jgi:hypothetical protein
MSITGFSSDYFVLNPQFQNSYSYASNNPVNNIDPDGRRISDYTQDGTNPGSDGQYTMGDTMGYYKGTPLYAGSGAPLYNGPIETQCAAGTQRIFSNSFGINIGPVGSALNMQNLGKNKPATFAKLDNSMLPAENDIIVWKGGAPGSATGMYGHVGVIAQVDYDSDKNEGTVWTIEQNSNRKTNLYGYPITRGSNGHYNVSTGGPLKTAAILRPTTLPGSNSLNYSQFVGSQTNQSTQNSSKVTVTANTQWYTNTITSIKSIWR